MPKPPSSRCVPPVRRRRRSIFELTAESRALLCPFVGPEGLTCSDVRGVSARSQASVNHYGLQKPDSNGFIQLSRGVGIAFDLSTGRLTFPAFSWTFEGGTRWQEHRSKRIFLIPVETELDPIYTTNPSEYRDEEIYRKFNKDSVSKHSILDFYTSLNRPN